MKSMTSLVAGAGLLVLTAGVQAAEPVALSDADMDGVSAGALVLLNSMALAYADGMGGGNLLSLSTVATQTISDPTGALTAPEAVASNGDEPVVLIPTSIATAGTTVIGASVGNPLAGVVAPAMAIGGSSSTAELF